MADPIIPPVEEIDAQTASYSKLKDVITQSGAAYSLLNSVAEKTGINFKELTNMGTEASNAFGLMNTKLLQVSDSFSKLGGADFSNSYIKQFEDIKKSARWYVK